MTIRSYRHRLTLVEAMPYTTLTQYDALDWIRTNGGRATEAVANDSEHLMVIKKPVGNELVRLGDWVLRDKHGEFSACEPSVFAAMYEPADSALPADRATLFEEAADAVQQNVHCQTRAESNAKTSAVDLLRRLAGAEQRTGLAAVLLEICAERARQDRLWGEQNHPDGTGLLGSHQAADQARASCQIAADQGSVTWRHISDEEHAEVMAETDPVRLRAELLQDIAVKVAWIQAIDRRPGAHIPLSAIAEEPQS